MRGTHISLTLSLHILTMSIHENNKLLQVTKKWQVEHLMFDFLRNEKAFTIV